MTTDGKKIEKYLRRLQKGDRCFDGLINVSIGYVGYVVYKNLVDKSFLRDAISETYGNVIRYIGTMRADGNPLGWLCKIAQNEAYKINRRESMRQDERLDNMREDDAGAPDMTDSIAEAVDLYRAIDRLDETERKIIEYIYFEDMPYKAIAAELGISAGDISYRKKSALKKLFEFLSD